jgi:hypothetical protein
MILKAFSDDGVVVDSALPGSQWRKRAKQRHALLHNLARGLQRIGEDAASGDKDAYGPMLRVLQLTHDVFTPTKDEQNGYGLGGPRPPVFERPAPQPAAPAHQQPEDETAVVIDGEPVPTRRSAEPLGILVVCIPSLVRVRNTATTAPGTTRTGPIPNSELCILADVWFDRRFIREPPLQPDRVSPSLPLRGACSISRGRLIGPRRPHEDLFANVVHVVRPSP